MAPLTWANPGSNTLSSVDPALDAAVNPNYGSDAPWKGINGQVSVVSAWSGAAWNEAERKLYITGGGHGDYAGNELYTWDAMTATFARVNNPSGAIGNTGTLNDGNDATNPCYFDGRPRSAHNYGNLAIVDGVFWNFQGSNYSTGFGIRSPFRWSGSDWIRDSTVTFGASYGSTIWDSYRSRFLLISSGNGQPTWFKPSDKSTGQMSHWTNNDEQEMFGVYDSRRDVVVQFSKYVTCLKCDDSTDAATITYSGTPPTWSTYTTWGKPSRSSIVYDYANDRYLVWGNGSSIYVLTPPAFGQNPLTATWAWSKIDPDGSNAVTPSSATDNGTYGRFWYSPSLNCCGVVNSVTQKMYVFALG